MLLCYGYLKPDITRSSSKFSVFSRIRDTILHSEIPSTNDSPMPPNHIMGKYSRALTGSMVVLGSLLARGSKVNAIGALYEFKEQPMLINDVSFNVIETESEAIAFEKTFENACQILRTSRKNGENSTVLGFGPDSYRISPDFLPGVTNLAQYGGHATITIHSQQLDEDTVLAFEKGFGNGLSFIKIGADNLRLSKAIAAGAKILSGYGYVDLETQGGIPLQIVIGDRRDPLMNACLRVSDLASTVDFLQATLGMKVLPFQLARPAGSIFEAVQPEGSVYMGYSEDTFGLLLVPVKKGVSVSVGSQLRGFSILFDDSRLDNLPPVMQDAKKGVVTEVKSPDGYTFFLQPYSVFNSKV
eukprot:gene6952-14113_t